MLEEDDGRAFLRYTAIWPAFESLCILHGYQRRLEKWWLASALVAIWFYGWIKGRFRGSLIAVPVISSRPFACVRLWDLLERCALQLGVLILLW